MPPLQIVSTIAIIKCQDKFLLVQRALDDDIFPGRWQNLGGKVELGETVEEAIKREITEEVGLDINVHPIYVQSYSWKKDNDSPVRLGLIFMFNLEGTTENYQITLDSELMNYGWYTYEQAQEMDQVDKLIGKDHPTGTMGQISQANQNT